MKWHTALIENIKMLKRINSLQALREERGSILVLTAVLLPLMLGMLGFAYDVGNLYMHKSRLQNVADAAALAGARAFIDSQSKKEGPKDALDTTTSTDKSELYTLNGGSKNRGEPHADADTAADNYIYKNMVNLGNSVKSDKYSHYALESSGKAYYRIGLSEEVPLYFLPIILKNKYSQNVSVDAIALLPAEEEDEFPPTIFGSLYTYSGYLNVNQGTMTNPNSDALGKKPTEGGATINMTFDGKMIYTGQSTSGYYGLQDDVEHMYTRIGKAEQIRQNLSVREMGTRYSNDPKKTTKSINLSDYQAILNSKLAQPHIELDMTNQEGQDKLTVDNINNLNSELYVQQQTDKDGNGLYELSYGGKNYSFAVNTNVDVNSSERYYSYDSNNNKIKYLWYNDGNVPSYTSSKNFNDDKGINYDGCYVLDESGNKIYYKIYNDDVFFANENGIQLAKINKNATEFKYTNSGNEVAIDFALIKRDNLQNASKLSTKINTNVIHLTGTSNKTLTIDKKVTGGGDLTQPLYIINDTNQEMQVTVTASNVRPIVIIHNGTNAVRVSVSNGAIFDAVVYAPNVTGGGEDGVTVKLYNSSYMGNIVASNISISNSGPASFTQVNYLETDSSLYEKIVARASELGQLFGDDTADLTDPSNPPSKKYNNNWQQWYENVGAEAATAWFNSLTDAQKNAFWTSWDKAKRPTDTSLLDDWYENGWKTNWFFKAWSPSEEVIRAAKNNNATVSDEKIRLINPRIEENPFYATAS